MPFGLLNVEAMYQRLVNLMFKDHIGKIMEIYVDDMLVKSTVATDHIAHLPNMFDILEVPHEAQPSELCFWNRVWEVLGFHCKPPRNIGESCQDKSTCRDEISKEYERFCVWLEGWHIWRGFSLSPQTSAKSSLNSWKKEMTSSGHQNVRSCSKRWRIIWETHLCSQNWLMEKLW